MNAKPVTALGVPTSAGAHHAGQDRAAQALRDVGFIDRLRAAGLDIEDGGDVAGEVFAPDHEHPRHRNLAAVVRVARAVADATAGAIERGRIPLLLGGDCTITLGVVAGVQRQFPDAGLLYLDGDADLSTPQTTRGGVLDAMGIAHLIGEADTELARLDRPAPMLADTRLVLIGFDVGDPDAFDAGLLSRHPGLRAVSGPDVAAEPVRVARDAVAALADADAVIVHFDVDVVESGDLPLGNFPHYGTGVPLDVAAQVLRILCAAPRLAAVVLTEINPSYDPSGTQLARYVDAIAAAISAGMLDR